MQSPRVNARDAWRLCRLHLCGCCRLGCGASPDGLRMYLCVCVLMCIRIARGGPKLVEFGRSYISGRNRATPRTDALRSRGRASTMRTLCARVLRCGRLPGLSLHRGESCHRIEEIGERKRGDDPQRSVAVRRTCMHRRIRVRRALVQGATRFHTGSWRHITGSGVVFCGRLIFVKADLFHRDTGPRRCGRGDFLNPRSLRLNRRSAGQWLRRLLVLPFL